jgi:hypothetical protein
MSSPSPVHPSSIFASFLLPQSELKERDSEKIEAGPDKLSIQAKLEREKIKNHTCNLQPNPQSQSSDINFSLPTLSFSVADVELFFSGRLKEKKLISEGPRFIGGAAGHILGKLPYCDVDFCFEIAHLLETDILEMLSKFIFERLVNDKNLDLRNFLQYVMRVIKTKTSTSVIEPLIKFLCEKTKDLELESILSEVHSYEDLEKKINIIKEVSGFDLHPLILNFLKSASFNTQENKLFKIDDLLFDFIQFHYLYIQKRLSNGFVVSFKGIDLKFLVKPLHGALTKTRTFVALHDSLQVPYEDDQIFCASSNFEESWRALLYRQFVVPNASNVFDLAYRVSMALTQGFKVDPEVLSSAHKKLMEDLEKYKSESEKKSGKEQSFTLRFQRHLEGHYFQNETGELLDFLNFIFIILHTENTTQQKIYLEKVIQACLPNSKTDIRAVETISLLFAEFFNQGTDNKVEIFNHLMNLIRGSFFYSWIAEQNHNITGYVFALSDHNGLLHERFSLHFGIKHTKGTHFLALPHQTPYRLAEEFFKSWMWLEKIFPGKDLSIFFDRFATIFGIENPFKAPKTLVLKTVVESFDKALLRSIIEHFLSYKNGLDPLLNISPGSFFRFVACNFSEHFDAVYLDKKLLPDQLRQLSFETECNGKIKLKLLINFILTMVVNKNFIPNEDLIEELSILLKSLIHDSDREELIANINLKSCLAFAICQMLCSAIQNKIIPGNFTKLLSAAYDCGILTLHERNIGQGLVLGVSLHKDLQVHFPVDKIISNLGKWGSGETSKELNKKLLSEVNFGLLNLSEFLKDDLAAHNYEAIVFSCLSIIADSYIADEIFIQKYQQLAETYLSHIVRSPTPLNLRTAGLLVEQFLTLNKRAVPKTELILSLSKQLLFIKQVEKGLKLDEYHELGNRILLLAESVCDESWHREVQRILFEKIFISFLLKGEAVRIHFCKFVNELGKLESIKKQFMKELEQLHKLTLGTFDQGRTLQSLVQIVIRIDYKLAEKICSLEKLQGQFSKTNIELNELGIIQAHIDTAEKDQFQKGFQTWFKNQILSGSQLHSTSSAELLKARIVTVARLIPCFLEQEKIDIETIEKLGFYLLESIRENQGLIEGLAKESTAEIQGHFKNALEALALKPVDARQLALVENLIDLSHSFFSKEQIDLLYLHIIEGYLNIREIPKAKTIDHFLSRFFNHHEVNHLHEKYKDRILTQTCSLFQLLNSSKKESNYFLVIDNLQVLLQSTLINQSWNSEIEVIFFNLFTAFRNIKNHRYELKLSELVTLLVNLKKIQHFEKKINFLKTLFEFDNPVLLVNVWEEMRKLKPFTREEISAFSSLFCLSGSPKLIHLIYEEFQILKSLSKEQCFDIVQGLAKASDPSLLQLLEPSGFIRNELNILQLTLHEKVIFFQSVFQYVINLFKNPPLDKAVTKRCEEFVETTFTQWCHLVPFICKEDVVIREQVIQILIDIGEKSTLLKAGNLFINGNGNVTEEKAYQILLELLRLPTSQQTDEVISLLKKLSDLIKRGKLSGFEFREIVPLCEAINRFSCADKKFIRPGFDIFQCVMPPVREEELKKSEDAKNNRAYYRLPKLGPIIETNISFFAQHLFETHDYKDLLILERQALTYLENDPWNKYKKTIQNIVISFSRAISGILEGLSDVKRLKEIILQTKHILPICISHNIVSLSVISKIANYVIKKHPHLSKDILDILQIEKSAKYSSEKMKLRFDLLTALCSCSNPEIVAKAPEIIESQFVLMQDIKPQSATSEIVNLEFNFIKMLCQWEHPRALEIALNRLLYFQKIIPFPPHMDYIKLWKLLEYIDYAMILKVMETKVPEKLIEYHLYLSFIKQLCSFTNPKNSGEMMFTLIQKIMERLFKHSIDLMTLRSFYIISLSKFDRENVFAIDGYLEKFQAGMMKRSESLGLLFENEEDEKTKLQMLCRFIRRFFSKDFAEISIDQALSKSNKLALDSLDICMVSSLFFVPASLGDEKTLHDDYTKINPKKLPSKETLAAYIYKRKDEFNAHLAKRNKEFQAFLMKLKSFTSCYECIPSSALSDANKIKLKAQVISGVSAAYEKWKTHLKSES